VGGKTLGVLDLHSRKRTVRTQIELDVLQTLADQVGVAIRNAELYTQALEAKAEAERANQLKTRLLANVSHELRTPLNIILGYSQAALSEPNPYGTLLPDELRHDLHHILRSGQHLVRLVEDLLNLSQAEIGALELYPEVLDTHAFLTEVFDSMAGSVARENVAWRLQLPATLPSLHGDPVRLRQVLLNLLSNATKFTSHGHITLSAVAEAPNLHIWVEDTGVGIPPDLHRQILEAYITGQAVNGDGTASVKGMGLGLSVAHRVVVLHGGRLWLESQPGHGTICHVHLPLGDENSATAQPEIGAVDNVVPMTLQPLLDSVVSQAAELVQGAAQFVGEHYASGFVRGELAAALGLSPDYVSRVFRRETGMSLKQYLSRYRVAQAQKLLQTTPLTVTQIACAVGFDDSAYFSRVFHHETGKTPRQYRKNTN
jgi:signal transduction histidine kinase/AraC-like DNA-binding protein